MKNLIVQFCQRALSETRDLSAGERADYYDLAADILRLYDMTSMTQAARIAARDLREAEASQLQFQALLSSAQN